MLSNYYWLSVIDFLCYNREEILSVTTKNVYIYIYEKFAYNMFQLKRPSLGSTEISNYTKKSYCTISCLSLNEISFYD